MYVATIHYGYRKPIKDDQVSIAFDVSDLGDVPEAYPGAPETYSVSQQCETKIVGHDALVICVDPANVAAFEAEMLAHGATVKRDGEVYCVAGPEGDVVWPVEVEDDE